ncbi:MAG TPA: NmrA family NAD(P)-binding protein, partial [Candidatus Limnocylindrales bacterium]|nr:NmrA family NAD(P)-binding protein [Candidatus Limnocylindrales bacterium]
MHDAPIDSTAPILVTGALGTIGRQVTAGLIAAGQQVRAADLDPVVVGDRLGVGVEVVGFDFTDRSTWRGAFEGVQVMFLMRPPQLANIA